ncbi:MAG: VTT domain-containing protein [Gammaproteobacteria bacterium]|jgi:phosphatidylserine/phosphatidylglycerophosphate/cardiolipin synthase-like enzyme/uncharacterized membrane protein YdjX (TVP38/TMEM64 family)
MHSILREDHNCWRVAKARRIAFLIDGEAYFRAVREAMCRARHSIFIIGWDIHSELRLLRNGDDDGYPQTLGRLLNGLAKQRRNLNIYILNWDFAMIYAMEREFFPDYRMRWKSHDRVHFCLDGNHPVGASQHQKVVVIDDQVAFCGGFDLSKWRWDTSQHLIDDERRIDPDGNPYPPFHDVQMIVDGDAASALGDLVRDRWRTAAESDAISQNHSHDNDPWPPGVETALENVEIGIARTLPGYRIQAEVREVERLYHDSIEAASKFIYIENQYLSCHAIGQALATRLEERDGPEIIIVVPEKTGGWLEQHTMDVLRARLLQDLYKADKHDRLRVYYVQLARDSSVSLMIHAKVMIVDDCFARVASSNLSNRSMGLDSECDLAVESTASQDCGDAISGFRQQLLAEHLGVEIKDLAAAEAKHGSLIAAIDSLRGGDRSLEPLSVDLPAEVDEWVPESKLLDPEKPVEPEEFLDYVITPEQQKPAYRYALQIGMLLLAALALAALWRWTPLSDWLDIDRLTATARWIEESRFTPVLVLLAFVIGGLAVVPITLLIIATVSVFGPWWGAGYALFGAELAALSAFAVGHLLGRDAVSRLAGSRVNRVSKMLSSRGVLTIITLRIVPVAPFTVINIIAGVSDIRLRDFAVGSFIGMIPGVIGIAFLADRIVASLREPDAGSIIVLIAVIIALLLGLVSLRHWLRRKQARREQQA